MKLSEVVIASAGPAEESSDSVDPGLVRASKDVLVAVKKGDPKRLAAALKAAYSLCQGDDDEYEEEDDMMGEE